MLGVWGGILAGGKSSRFGRNKALHDFGGHTFIERAIMLLTTQCDKIIISASKTNISQYANLGLETVTDEDENLGPIEGIYTLLKHCHAERMIITTCDMPLLSSSTLKKMTEAPRHEIICWQNKDGSLQRFPMLISVDCINIIEKLIVEHNLKVSNLIDECDSYLLQISEQESEFANVNTIKDLNNIL